VLFVSPPLFSEDLIAEAARLIETLRQQRVLLATAESCTGGLVSALLTEVPGASDVFERGFVTYTNAAKIGMLGVDPEVIVSHGAVSAETAAAMALGALRMSAATLSVSITGIAGPDGGSVEKPVGLVHFAVARAGEPLRLRECRFGDLGRVAIRLASVREAVTLLGEGASGTSPS
jgi:nicotinamide-nucleotide amidase